MKSALNHFRLICSSIIVSLFFAFNSNGTGVSDTLHVIKYAISIDSINYTAKTISGKTTVLVQSKQNGVTTLPLSLLQMQVNGVINGVTGLSYTYNDTTIRIVLPSTLNLNDTVSVTIFYQGQPKQDASGWGGFYFSGTYAFNMGVGFAADPHNLGKIWFPCIDEFTDHSLYDFFITTPSSYKAFCNGVLSNQTSNLNGTVTWFWQMNQPIPTYLASIAVAPFYTLQRTSNGLDVEWACMPADTASTLSTFQHIDSVLSSFITAYGPYPFDKVGYVEIPFNSGAMEHATSIHIGKAFVNGTLNYETLWAHELSHMWWGDKVTCETAGDMWLNEGFASFNEAFITQKLYGDVAYKNWIRSNHRVVLQTAHIDDGGYLSFLNVPAAYTYGTTVYKKGADVAHTLRNYMGDSLFFQGCKYYMNQHAYGNANSYQLRDDLTTSSGIDMTRFFDDWIFTEGFPHFSIDSVEYVPAGVFDHYWVHTRQRIKGNNNHLYKMPVEVTLSNGVMDTTVTVVIDSATNVFHIAVVGVFDFFALDRNEKISDAITDYERTITTTGIAQFPETNVLLNVQNTGGGSSLVRVEHNWVKSDDFKMPHPGIKLSDYHYWKIDGIFTTNFLSKATFNYNGSSTPNGNLDNTLITNSEDSLILFYRAAMRDEWQPVNGFTINHGASVTDKFGNIVIDTLKKGEYVLGIYDYATGLSENKNEVNNYLTVSPNPSNDTFNISIHFTSGKKASLKITDSKGSIIEEKKLSVDQLSYQWNARSQKPGTYFVSLILNDKVLQTQKIIYAP